VVSREIDFKKRVFAHFNDLRSHFFSLPIATHVGEHGMSSTPIEKPVVIPPVETYCHTCGGAWHVQYSHSDKKHEVGTCPLESYSYYCHM
jgi:hypothetical protein